MKTLLTLFSNVRHVLVGCALLFAAATSLLAASPEGFSEPVLERASQDIVTFRGTYDGTSPAARVERALSRIQALEAMEQQSRWPVLMQGMGLAVVQTLLLGLVFAFPATRALNLQAAVEASSAM